MFFGWFRRVFFRLFLGSLCRDRGNCTGINWHIHRQGKVQISPYPRFWSCQISVDVGRPWHPPLLFLLFHILNIFELTKRMLHRHTYYVILSTRIRRFFVSHVRYITTRVAKVNRMRRKNGEYGVDRNARNFQNGRRGGYIIHDFCFTNNTKMNFKK